MRRFVMVIAMLMCMAVGSQAYAAEPIPCRSDEACDDHNICNGVETCDVELGCQPGKAPEELPAECAGCCERTIVQTQGTVPTGGTCDAPVTAAFCESNNGVYRVGATCDKETGQCARCGDGVVQLSEQCDPGDGFDPCCTKDCQFAASGTECPDDENNCTDDTCNGQGVCQHVSNTAPCDDGNFCTDGDVCNDSQCQAGAPKDCDDHNVCTSDSCNPDTQACDNDPNPNMQGQNCDASSLCATGQTCNEGVCQGGVPIVCDDASTCTSDSCDPLEGCVFETVVESPACASCDDGVDNDDNGKIDAEQCDCATMCEQQHFAVVTTLATGPRRYPLYTGSDVVVSNVPGSGDPNAPYPVGTSNGGLCGTNMEIRAGTSVGFLATTGDTKWGQGTTLERDIDVRGRFLSAGGIEKIKSAAPLVGPGLCSNDASVCVADADCGAGNTCDGRLRLDEPNASVDRTGTDPEFLQCQAAIATVATEAAFLATVSANVVGYDDGTVRIKTSASSPNASITVGSGQQVMNVRAVILAGGTTLTITGQPDTVLVIRVQRQLRLGGDAQIVLAGGLTPNNVLWVAEGTRGGKPKLLRASTFVGTVLAADRRGGILVGGATKVTGALKAKKVHVSQEAQIDHVPFTALVQ